MTLLLERPTESALSLETEWERIVAALTRRELVERGAGLGLAALLGGDLAASANASSPAMRTISTARGAVKIPVAPRRIVTVDWYSLPILLDLGYKPVGVPTDLADALLPAYQPVYHALTKIGSVNEPSLERIAALKPDLIVGLDRFNGTLYSKLNGIAPTALFRWESSSDWAALAHSVADAIGRLPAGQSLKTRYDERAAAIRARHRAVLARTRWDMATGGVNGGQAVGYLWRANSDTGSILAAAGVRFAKASAARVAGGVSELSFEQLDQLGDADVIVVEGTAAGKVGSYSKPLVAQPTFKLLAAAKAGHVFPLAQFFPTSYRQALALLDELDGILARL